MIHVPPLRVEGLRFSFQYSVSSSRGAEFWQGDFHNGGHETASGGSFEEPMVSEGLFDLTDGNQGVYGCVEDW